MDLIPALGQLLSDTVVVKFRAHGHHWNVTGPMFVPLHELFGAIYLDLDESIDPIAENIRKLGAPSPFRLIDFLAASEVPETPMPADAEGMVNDLIDGLDGLLGCLVETFEAATEVNQQGIANFTAERIDATQKWLWQLRVITGRPFPPVELVEPAEDPAEDAAEGETEDAGTDPVQALAMRLELANRA
jgi:starvation-inducible DNA-binding protein